jgi:signal transduction histidine kinase
VELRWFPNARDATLRGNLDRLRQLVINLLLNAIEAASQGRAQANTAAEVVVELAEEPPNSLILSVADSGPGPAESVRGQLFEPFVTGKPDGVGLGLSVARAVAEEHGGHIAWQRTGNRTRFSVTFHSIVHSTSSTDRLVTSA